MITSLQLPFTFNKQKLVDELDIVLQSQWVPHFNQQGYTGNWNSIALYAPNGDPSNIYALQNEEVHIEATPLLKEIPYIDAVINHFKCKLLAVRLLCLSPRAYIKPHRDFELGYEDGTFRIHIPITTNPDVDFILNEEKLCMLPGECWYTNVNYIHSVANRGTTDRVHLVIDGERNDWSDDLFFGLGPKEEFFKVQQEDQYTKVQLEGMIRELKMVKAPAAEALIQKYQTQLEAATLE